MTRSRRAAIVALLALPLGDYRAWAQEKPKPGRLTIPLDKWAGVAVSYKGQERFVSAADIFAALGDV